MLRVGRVASVDAKRHTARVLFLDKDLGGEAVESDDLPVLVAPGGDYGLPPKDALVMCAINPEAEGTGCILGRLYSEADDPPLDDAGKRAVVGDDLRLGSADASDAVALAPAVKQQLDHLKQHFDALEGVIKGAAINEPGNGSPSALQTALKAAVLATPYPSPGDVGAGKVKAS